MNFLQGRIVLDFVHSEDVSNSASNPSAVNQQPHVSPSRPSAVKSEPGPPMTLGGAAAA